MKVFTDPIPLTLTWTFTPPSSLLRSNVVGGYQGEVYGGRVKIINQSGQVVYDRFCGLRAAGRKIAAKIIGKFLQGTP